jgi:hypothetical protein
LSSLFITKWQYCFFFLVCLLCSNFSSTLLNWCVSYAFTLFFETANNNNFIKAL